MKPLALFLTCFWLGAGDAILTGILGLMFGAFFFLAALPLASRSERSTALAGLLIGFGATWLALLERQAASGGQLDGPAPWFALGVAPLLVGLALLAIRLAHARVRQPGGSTGS